MLPTCTIHTPAKLNLSLHISGRTHTPPFKGYHLIESLVSFVDIYDTITLTPTTDGIITLSVSGVFAKHIPTNNDNLVARAIKMIRPCRSYGCRVHMDKNVPVGGGVGGGSSNAGGTITALSKLWQTPVPSTMQMATLGADIPICTRQQDGFVTGIGDVITPLHLPPYHVVIAFPYTAVMTPHIYKQFATKGTFSSAPPIPEQMDYNRFINVLHQGQNDLMPICMSLYPEVQHCLDVIKSTGADYANISGSGACCFGIYNSIKNAQKALDIVTVHNFWAKIGAKI